MKGSPLQSLLTHQIYSYVSSSPPSAFLRLAARRRLFSIKSPSNGTVPGGFGSSEPLKRRYQRLTTRYYAKERERVVKKMKVAFAGVVVCTLCVFGIVQTMPPKKSNESKSKSTSNHVSFDAPPSIAGVSSDTSIDIPAVELVPTGTTTIPYLPKAIHLTPSSSVTEPAVSTSSTSLPTSLPAASPTTSLEQEYTLLGLGIRTISFLSIQVYVLGLYVSQSTLARLQSSLIHQISPFATTLVANERTQLRNLLMDPIKGEEAWNTVLKTPGVEIVIRIVPTRNTDFSHLRDGWVRGITGKVQRFNAAAAAADPNADEQKEAFHDDAFAVALDNFKAIFGGRGRVPKGEALLLSRSATGALEVYSEDKTGNRVRLGRVDDERIARLILLGYLGGATVSSASARASIVEGVDALVARPVGTV